MKQKAGEKPQQSGSLSQKLRRRFEASGIRGVVNTVIDQTLVATGWLPEEMDGSGCVLHLSDTPSSIYGYLARLLRRTNPSVVIHTGDLADDIKLELYCGEREHYHRAACRLLNILRAPHRRVFVTLGNHDDRELLPPDAPDCVVTSGTTKIAVAGAVFHCSHYIEWLYERPAHYNLYGHCSDPPSFDNAEGCLFFNGMESIRLIEPSSGRITNLRYPRGTNSARLLRGGCR